MTDTDLENTKISLRTMVIVIVCVVTWAGSVAGLYFTGKSHDEETQKRVTKVEDRLDKFNPEVLSVEIRDIKENVNDIKESTKEIRDILNTK